MSNNNKKSYKNILLTFGPALILVIIGFWVATKFISPAPPKQVTISTGSSSGAYYQFAQSYRQELAKEGIELTILTSSGSQDNITRLLEGKADIAFVQSGIGEQNIELVTLQNHL